MAAGDVTLATDENLAAILVTGAALHSHVFYPFGNIHRVEDLFKPVAGDDIKLKLTGEASAGAIKVGMRQLRTGD